MKTLLLGLNITCLPRLPQSKMRRNIFRGITTHLPSFTDEIDPSSILAVIALDTAALKALASNDATRTGVSFDLAKADAYMFGDDEDKLRSPDTITSRWDRRMKWLAKVHLTLPRVTIKGLHHAHATLLLELGEHPRGYRSA